VITDSDLSKRSDGCITTEAADPYALPLSLQVRLIDSAFTGRVVVGALRRKVLRKLTREQRGIEPIAIYNGLVVFDAPGLHGGGTVEGQNYLRTLLQLGFCRCERVLEFASGPGYAGYSLLANGFCRTLALTDVNPAAIQAARVTANFNRIDHLVSIYLSDALDSIPAEERRDIVISTPPWSSAPRTPNETRWEDPEFDIHRRFYAQVKNFMRPGGHVVMLEGSGESRPDIFTEMIENGGGEVIDVFPAVALNGDRMYPYYVVSRW
jgi:SAM-dependent methyltransferase